jgi:uncharacterized protein YlaI
MTEPIPIPDGQMCDDCMEALATKTARRTLTLDGKKISEPIVIYACDNCDINVAAWTKIILMGLRNKRDG